MDKRNQKSRKSESENQYPSQKKDESAGYRNEYENRKGSQNGNPSDCKD